MREGTSDRGMFRLLSSPPSSRNKRDVLPGLMICKYMNNNPPYISTWTLRSFPIFFITLFIIIYCTIINPLFIHAKEHKIHSYDDRTIHVNSFTDFNDIDIGSQILDCSSNFLHPLIVRNRTVSTVRMNYMRGISKEERGSCSTSLSTIQIDIRKFEMDDSHTYLLGHFLGSEALVADFVEMPASSSNGSTYGSGETQGMWIIYSGSDIVRAVRIGKVVRNTKFYVYSMNYFRIHGIRRVALAGELPSPYIEIAGTEYQANAYLMIFQFSQTDINNHPSVNKVSDLPAPIFPPPRVFIPSIMGNVPVVIVKDVVFGMDATLYFAGVFNTRLQFLDNNVVLESKKDNSIFFGALDPNTGKVVFAQKVEPLPSSFFNTANINLLKLSPKKKEIFVAGTLNVFIYGVGNIQKSFVSCYDITNSAAPVILWSNVLDIPGVKEISDMVITNDGHILVNIQLANFSNIVTHISKYDGREVSNLIQYDTPYFGARMRVNIDNDLLIVGKKGDVFSDIDWDSSITFGVQGSITLFAQKFTLSSNDAGISLNQVYFEPFIKGSVMATQPLIIATDSFNSRKFYISSTFSGNLQIFGDTQTVVAPLGYSNGIISTLMENCHSCEDDCKIPMCGFYTQDDTRSCSGRGKCEKSNECSCVISKYSGDVCQYPICYGIPQNESSVCSGNGRCAFPDYCVCNQNFLGESCQIASCFNVTAIDPAVCSSNGECVGRDICKCFQNYTGENCEAEIVQGYTHCGEGKYLETQTDANFYPSPIELYGYPPSLFVSFDRYGEISYTGYGISSTENDPNSVGLSIKYKSPSNSTSLYSTQIDQVQNSTQENFIVTSVTSDEFNNTWLVGWMSRTSLGSTQYTGVLLKINTDGVIQQRREFGNVIPESVRLSEDNTMIFITGGYRGTVEIDPYCSTTSSSLVNTIIFQLSSFELVCMWMTTSEGMSKGFSVLPDSIDHVVIAGIFKSAIRFSDKQIVDTTPGVLSYYFLKFGPMSAIGTREVLWIQTITTNSSSDDNLSSSDDFLTSEFSSVLKFDPNRNILFSGEFGSFVRFQTENVTSNYERNFFLTKTDSNGFLQNMLTFQNVYNTSFDVDPSGYTYVTGVIKPGGSNVGDPNNKDPRFFAGKYCVKNHLKWYKETPLDKTTNTEYGSVSAAYDTRENIFVVAFFNKTTIDYPTIYTVLFKDETCNKCPLGSFSSDKAAVSNDTCQLCDYGYYGDKIAASSCKPCPESTYNPRLGSISKDACLLCEPGSYSDQPGLKYCKPCSEGEYVNTTGATQCIPCDIGTYAPTSGLDECLPCPPGTFSDLLGALQCTACDSGTYQPFYGQNSTDSCLKCLPGSYAESDQSSACLPCSPGSSNPNYGSKSGTDCQKCPAGQYADKEGSESCLLCDIGTYSSVIGSTNSSSCLLCPLGQYNNRKGQPQCNKCSAGTYLPKQGSQSESDCKLCPIGFFANHTGLGSCFKCPLGMTTENAGSQNATDCVPCKPGSFLNTDFQCETCPFSTYSADQGAISCTSCPLRLPTFTTGNTEVGACLAVPIIIIVSLILLTVIAIPVIIFGCMFRRQAITLKRKKRAEDEMLSKLLEHNVKSSYYSSMDSTHKSANLIPIEELEFKERVSEGAGGVIFRASWRGTEVAVKRIKSNQFGIEDDETFEHEANILMGLRHPNVVLLLGVTIDEDNKYIITEFIKGGSLDKLIYHKKKAKNEIISFGRKIEILKDICRSLVYLHNTRPPIIHRDLKPQNVLIDEIGTCKVCDFGVSKPLSSLTMTGVCYGTIQYTSPEILKQSRRYTVKCDVYSFAILMYELFFMTHPYSDLPKSPIIRKLGESSQLLSSGDSSSDFSGAVTSENMNIFSIGNEVIHGRRPTIPWEGASNNELQIQASDDDLNVDNLKQEWFKYCNKPYSKKETKRMESITPIIDEFITLMKQCWANDDSQRPDFSQVLESLEELEQSYKKIVDN